MQDNKINQKGKFTQNQMRYFTPTLLFANTKSVFKDLKSKPLLFCTFSACFLSYFRNVKLEQLYSFPQKNPT